MSNHSGSYMLNSVLILLDEHNFRDFIGPEKTQQFLSDILKLGHWHDCNDSEILDNGIGPRWGRCYYCGQRAETFKGEVCVACHAEYWADEDTDEEDEDEGD